MRSMSPAYCRRGNSASVIPTLPVGTVAYQAAFEFHRVALAIKLRVPGFSLAGVTEYIKRIVGRSRSGVNSSTDGAAGAL